MYRAVLIIDDNSISKIFHTEQEARSWIDANNNNYENRSFIQRLSKDYRVLDSFCYTE